MQNSGIGLIQAIEWKPDSPVISGTIKGVSVIHCIADGDITAHFVSGDKTRSFLAGDDVTLSYVDITVVSGAFDIN